MEKNNDYKMKQEVARKIEDYAKTDRWNNNSFFEIAFNDLGRMLDSVSKLNLFAAKVAETVEKTMNPYGKQVAFISSKQAWILACAVVDNGIEF